VLFPFYIQGELELKKNNSCAKRLILVWGTDQSNSKSVTQNVDVRAV